MMKFNYLLLFVTIFLCVQSQSNFSIVPELQNNSLLDHTQDTFARDLSYEHFFFGLPFHLYSFPKVYYSNEKSSIPVSDNCLEYNDPSLGFVKELFKKNEKYLLQNIIDRDVIKLSIDFEILFGLIKNINTWKMKTNSSCLLFYNIHYDDISIEISNMFGIKIYDFKSLISDDMYPVINKLQNSLTSSKIKISVSSDLFEDVYIFD